MDASNSILKLSNKNKNGANFSISPKVEIPTELIDSQRMNFQEEQPQELIPQVPTDSKQEKSPEEPKPPDSQSNSKPSEKSQSHKSRPESPLSQSKINEIIYGNNYGDPAIDNINVNEIENPNIQNDGVIIPDILDNVGATPVSVNCPHCNSQIQSNVNSSCNCCTCFLIILMIIIFPIMCVLSIYRAGSRTSRCCSCYGVDDEESGGGGSCNCCNDVKHTCPKCGTVIAESDSCSRLFSCI